MFPVAHPPMILTPRHFSGIGGEISAADMVMGPDFGAAQAGEETLGLIRASVVLGIGLFVVDPLREVAVMQNIP